MKIKLKKSIKFGIILFGLLFFFHSCEKEDSFVIERENGLVVKKKMFNQFTELSSIIEKTNTLIQSAARENNNELYDFVVLEEEVLQAITENGVWYTIKIQRDTFNPSFFENLVIRQDANGVIKAFLIKYFPDADYLNRIQYNPDTYFSGKQKIKEIEPEYIDFSTRTTVSSRGVECFSYTYTYCGWNGGEASVGDACYANTDGGAHVVSETRLICYDTGGEYISDGTEDAVDVNLGTGTSGGSGGTVGNGSDNPEVGFDENGIAIISNPLPPKESIEKPCPGNPVPNPEIAPQLGNSGTKGAIYGCTRYGNGCTSADGRTKPHAGIDLKSEYGDPIYAMYSGFIFTTKNDPEGAGYYTRIQSTVNGETFLVEYYHMQEDNRILQGNPLVQVNAGDIIGYQGDSGNLKDAIADGTVESHVHIEVRIHDGSNQWDYEDNFNLADPRDYLSTTINDDGTSEENINCN